MPGRSMVALAALLATAILSFLAVFQAALAAGSPLGHFAWGGQHEVLPAGLRVGSVAAILIYVLVASLLLQKAALAAIWPADWVGIAVWIVAAYFALGIALNAISRSRAERLVMTPVVTALFILSLVLALH